jgi:hypothetical protein
MLLLELQQLVQQTSLSRFGSRATVVGHQPRHALPTARTHEPSAIQRMKARLRQPWRIANVV